MDTRLRFIAALAIVFCSFVSASAQGKKPEKKFINPEGLSKPTSYTHVVIAGGTVYISGQVAANEKGEVVGKGDLKAQATKVYQNLETCLKSAGLTFSDVVKMNTYIVNYKAENLPMLREVRKAFFTGENPPASTLVGVQGLANPDYLIEIEVVARK